MKLPELSLPILVNPLAEIKSFVFESFENAAAGGVKLLVYLALLEKRMSLMYPTYKLDEPLKAPM